MKICKVKSCKNKHYGKGYCSKHYMQVRNHGHILKRTIYTKNEFIIKKNYVNIILRNKNTKISAITKIDKNDLQKCKNIKWHFYNNYVYGWINKKHIKINRFILNITDPKIFIDHVDNNPLNNQKNNLRVCNQSQNMSNQNIPRHNKSGFKGVSFDKKTKKWKATIQVNKKQIHGGRFNTKKEAAIKYNEMAIKYFKNFAKLNKIKGVNYESYNLCKSFKITNT